MTIQSKSFSENDYFIPSMPVPVSGPPPKRTLISTLAHARKVINSPLETFGEIHFTEKVIQNRYLGLYNTFLNDPKLIRHCFLTNADNYKQAFVRQAILKPILGDGLLTIDGDQWKRSRKILSPVFAPRNVAGFATPMRQCCENYVEQMEVTSETVEVAPIMSELTFLILSETLFSGDINDDVQAMLESVAYLLENVGKPDFLDLLQAPTWIPRLSKVRGLQGVKHFRKHVSRIISNRKEALASGENTPNDFLTLLLQAEAEGNRLTLKEVEDNILTFIAAGHETTARGITWTLYLLSQSKTFRDKVEQEIDNLDTDTIPPEKWVDELPWTTASFEEAMRLYPPAALMTRMAIEDDNFEGVHIPAGSQLVLAPWLLHRHKTLWEHPERFDPERFIGENKNKIDRFAYLPFGVGARVCIGARFAMQEAAIILATLLRNLRFEYAGKAPPWPVLKITLQPDNNMPMKISRR